MVTGQIDTCISGFELIIGGRSQTGLGTSCDLLSSNISVGIFSTHQYTPVLHCLYNAMRFEIRPKISCLAFDFLVSLLNPFLYLKYALVSLKCSFIEGSRGQRKFRSIMS